MKLRFLLIMALALSGCASSPQAHVGFVAFDLLWDCATGEICKKKKEDEDDAAPETP